MRGPRLFVIAGEPSGDRLGASLIAGLRELAGRGLELDGIGGPAMEGAGFESRFPIDELAIMGLAEVVPAIPRILRRVRETAEAVADWAPDALVTIDSPDFTLRVAKRARALRPGLRTIHYVAPQVWAWRPRRAVKMARSIDHVLALLPFEPPYMEAAGMTCDFVGHPAAAVPKAKPAEIAALRSVLGFADRRVLAVLPGSRKAEVARHGPIFAATVRRLKAERPDLEAVAAATGPVVDLVRETMPGVAVLDPRGMPDAEAEMWKRASFGMADAALAVSGTVSVELAAQGTPTVIAYQANILSAAIARRLVRVDTATLVNLVTGKRAVQEFIFEACQPHLIAPALACLLDDPQAAAQQRAIADEALRLMGRDDEPPGLRAARSVLAAIRPPEPVWAAAAGRGAAPSATSSG
jgi:lipid-A-disaccharide synthase